MKLRVVWGLLKDTVYEWNEDKAPRLGAALAYYSIFSIAPLLVLVIAVASLIFGEKAAQGAIVREIEGTVGEPVANAIEFLLQQAHQEGGGVTATVIAGVTLLFGAAGVFGQLQDALNTIWKVKPKPGRAWLGMLKERFLSFVVVLGTGFLLLTSLVVSAALAALNAWTDALALPGGVYLWQAINGVVSFAFITLLFALVYKVLPDVRIAWRHVSVGAAVTALLFTLGKYLLGVYLGGKGVTSAYGAAGSLVVVLLWVYYSSQILLFGAEFTRAYARLCGNLCEPADNAMAVTEESRTRQGMPCTAAIGHG